MKNKSVKLPLITKNSKHLVQMICSQMKNKSVKLPFVTKNSKHLVQVEQVVTMCKLSLNLLPRLVKNKSVKLPFVSKKKYLSISLPVPILNV